MLPNKLVFVDTETTGLSVIRDRIIEIGLVRVENGKVVAKYQTLLNPQSYVSPFITSMTGITSEELENAPTFYSMRKDLQELLADAVFVAHNVRFDYGFLRNEFKRVEMTFTSKHFCTAKLSRALFPQLSHHNLDTIIERYGITCEKRHRAFDDAYVLWEFYKRLQKDFPLEALQLAISRGIKHPSSPLNLLPGTLESLPENPGVYIFYGESGVPLYVGKSINIKDRVLSHFASNHTDSKEMNLAQQVKSIETIQTAGELGALLKESQLVKQLQPLYNRKLRTSRRIVLVRSTKTKEGYESHFLEEAESIDPFQTDSIRGVFRSKKQAKEYLIHVTKEYGLCEKLTGIEKSKSACFGYRLGQCKGACLGKENPLVYNARCIIAFSKNKIKHWPFNGPIALREENTFSGLKDVFVVDTWCLLGKKSDELIDGVLNTADYRFDMDTYKILYSYIGKHQKNVTSLPPLLKAE